MAKERHCIFCGSTYEYCPHCGHYNNEPEWKFNFDSEKCHDLYEVIAGFNMGIKTIEDVKETLNKYNVTDYSIFSKKLQDALDKIVPQKEEEEPEVEKKIEIPRKENNFKSKKNKYNFERRVNTEE